MVSSSVVTDRAASASPAAAVSRSTPSALAISSTDGVRPSAELRLSCTASVSLMRLRADLVAQSLARSSSASAPRMRVRAYAPNGTPVVASYASAACTSASEPAEARSSRDRCVARAHRSETR